MGVGTSTRLVLSNRTTKTLTCPWTGIASPSTLTSNISSKLPRKTKVIKIKMNMKHSQKRSWRSSRRPSLTVDQSTTTRIRGKWYLPRHSTWIWMETGPTTVTQTAPRTIAIFLIKLDIVYLTLSRKVLLSTPSQVLLETNSILLFKTSRIWRATSMLKSGHPK
jgi:hypothetical protein